MIKKLLLITILVLWSVMALAAPPPGLGDGPRLYFSDLTDGTNNGWVGSPTKGAAVSIWVNYVDTVRGTSYVTVGGVNLTADTDYAEWGASKTPQTARDMQRITFWLNSSIPTGATTITVTTSAGTSPAIPFYVRDTGTIYFAAADGNNDNSGLNDTDQMWGTFYKVRNTLQAGDVCYFRSTGGRWLKQEEGAGLNGHAIFKMYTSSNMPAYGFNNGTENNSITVASYPGEAALMGDGKGQDTVLGGASSTAWIPDPERAEYFIYRQGSSTSTGIRYWTFSKFDANTWHNPFKWASSSYNKDYNTRVVGNSFTSSCPQPTHAHIINPHGHFTNLEILGNFLHGAGKVNDWDDHRRSYKGSYSSTKGIYFGGLGVSNGVKIMYNEDFRNNGHTQFFGHDLNDEVHGLVYAYNFVHEQGHTQTIVFGGSDYMYASDGYLPQHNFIYGPTKIHDNVFANTHGLTRFNVGGNGVQDGVGGESAEYDVYNNIWYNTANDFGVTKAVHSQTQQAFIFRNNAVIITEDSISASEYWSNATAGMPFGPITEPSNNESGSNNLWYGLGVSKAPTWDSAPLDDTDPGWIVTRPRTFTQFRQLLGSALTDSGIAISGRTVDTIGTTVGGSPDIGIFEYDASAPPPTCAESASACDEAGCTTNWPTYHYWGGECQVDEEFIPNPCAATSETETADCVDANECVQYHPDYYWCDDGTCSREPCVNGNDCSNTPSLCDKYRCWELHPTYSYCEDTSTCQSAPCGGGDSCETEPGLCDSLGCEEYWPLYHYCDDVCQVDECPAPVSNRSQPFIIDGVPSVFLTQ